MKISTVIWTTASVLLLGCTGNSPQATIDKWNADFGAQQQACLAGNISSCQIACRMSRNPQVCSTVKAQADLNDPKQRAWVEQCAASVASEGAAVCAAVERAASAPPGTGIPGGTPQGGVPGTGEITGDLQAQMQAMLEKLKAEQSKKDTDVDQARAALEQALQQAREAARQGNDAAAKTEPPTPTGQALTQAENTEVRGSLPKEVIRRIVQRHQSEFRYCYETRLADAPNLAGKVAVKFIISGTGAVQMAAVSESTLFDPAVETCVVNAFRRMVFPKPEGGGIVIVTYPLQFTQADR